MLITLNDELLRNIIDYASGIGQTRERINKGEEPEFISQNQAHLRFGKGNVMRWVRHGLVHRYKDAAAPLRSAVRYNLIELKAAAFKCNCLAGLSPAARDELKHTQP